MVDTFESVPDGKNGLVFDDQVGIEESGQLADDCVPDFRGELLSALFVEVADLRSPVVVLDATEIQKPFDDYGRY